MKKNTKRYIDEWLKAYIKSFKQLKTLKAGLVIIYDLLFYILALAAIALFSSAMMKILLPLGSFSPETLFTQSEAQLAAVAASMEGIYAKMVAAVAVFLTAVFLLWWISRAMIWSALLQKKPSLKYIAKFVCLNIIWCVIWLAPVYLVASPVARMSAIGDVYTAALYSLAVMAFMLIPTYFTYILYYTFRKEGRIFCSIKDAFVKGVMRFPRLAPPIITVMLTILAIALVSNILLIIPESLKVIMEFLSAVIFFGILTWAKIYSVIVMDKVL